MFSAEIFSENSYVIGRKLKLRLWRRDFLREQGATGVSGRSIHEYVTDMSDWSNAAIAKKIESETV